MAAQFPTPPRWLIPWISRVHVALYKLTAGRIGGKLAGKPGLLLRTIGARTGKAHTVCLPYLPLDGDRVVVDRAPWCGGDSWVHHEVSHRRDPWCVPGRTNRGVHADGSV